MSAAITRAARHTGPPSWLIKFIGHGEICKGWSVYSDGSRFALARKKGGEDEYHLLEKHAAALAEVDRSKHRLLWKGKLTRAGRDYLAVTLALSDAAGRIMRAGGKAQCTQCRRLIVLKDLEGHPCEENQNE
jgi:hypothetical protein